MTPDQERRLRDAAFDEDITHILDNVARWFEDDSADALAELPARYSRHPSRSQSICNPMITELERTA